MAHRVKTAHVPEQHPLAVLLHLGHGNTPSLLPWHAPAACCVGHLDVDDALLPHATPRVPVGESQACAAAAKERIEVLEQEAEQAATEQQAAADAATQALEEAKSVAATELQTAQEAAAAELRAAQEQQETDRKKLQAELEAVKVRSHTQAASQRVL